MFPRPPIRPLVPHFNGWRGAIIAFFLTVSGCHNPNEMYGNPAMQAPKVMTGVWITGFEETFFIPGATSMPDRNDPRRYMIWFDVDGNRVGKLLGRELVIDRYYRAIALTFVGRRSKYPLSIDCHGGRDYLVVADWVVKARDLGIVPYPDRVPLPSKLSPYKPFKPSGEGGVIAQMEKVALENCSGHRQFHPTR
jgi:hypothetical protein